MITQWCRARLSTRTVTLGNFNHLVWVWVWIVWYFYFLFLFSRTLSLSQVTESQISDSQSDLPTPHRTSPHLMSPQQVNNYQQLNMLELETNFSNFWILFHSFDYVAIKIWILTQMINVIVATNYRFTVNTQMFDSSIPYLICYKLQIYKNTQLFQWKITLWIHCFSGIFFLPDCSKE